MDAAPAVAETLTLADAARIFAAAADILETPLPIEAGSRVRIWPFSERTSLQHLIGLSGLVKKVWFGNRMEPSYDIALDASEGRFTDLFGVTLTSREIESLCHPDRLALAVAFGAAAEHLAAVPDVMDLEPNSLFGRLVVVAQGYVQ